MRQNSKSWVFTVNNYTENDIKLFEHIECNYISVGREVGESGTPHLQGYIKFSKAKRLTGMKKIHETAHWEMAYDDEAAINYTMKEGNFIVRDNRKKKGHRSDLDNICDMIKDGKTIKQVATEHPADFIRYHKGIERLQQVLQNEHEGVNWSLSQCCEYTGLRPLDLEGSQVLIGQPNSGKTAFALAHFERPLKVDQVDTLLEFDSDYHDGIVFDDMDFKHWHRTHQIHLTDWDNSRQIHCRFRNAKIPRHTKKIFTCNEYPFSDDPAVARRVTVTEVS